MSRLLLLILLFSACKPVAYFLYGVKKPKEMSEKDILKKAQHFDIDTSNMYCLNFEDWPTITNSLKGVPDMLVFNKVGEHIPYSENDAWICKSNIDGYLALLQPVDTMHAISPGRTLAHQLSTLRTLKGKKVELAELPPADFYVFAFWATFIGKVNKDNVPIWERDARSNTKAKVHLMKVSVDIQEWWDK